MTLISDISGDGTYLLRLAVALDCGTDTRSVRIRIRDRDPARPEALMDRLAAAPGLTKLEWC